MKRLFFALWPDDLIRRRCMEIQKLLPAQGLQRVTDSNLHVTLVFLGAVDQATELGLLKAAASIRVPEMHIIFDQLHFWKKPEVLCLTGRSQGSGLFRLVGELDGIAKQSAIAVDERPYQAHITLARKAKQTVVAEFEPVIWHAKTFCLVESCSGADGVKYQVRRSWGEL